MRTYRNWSGRRSAAPREVGTEHHGPEGECSKRLAVRGVSEDFRCLLDGDPDDLRSPFPRLTTDRRKRHLKAELGHLPDVLDGQGFEAQKMGASAFICQQVISQFSRE